MPKCGKNVVILVSSIFFYAWGEPKYVIIMIAMIFWAYISGYILDMCKSDKQRKIYLILAVGVCLGFLGYFKYIDFFIDNFNKVTGLSVSLLNVALPIGISFYTFQIISYMVDVYRGSANKQKNIIKLATYVSMFPQLIAGPILRYSDMEKQLDDRRSDIDDIALGIRRFMVGLGKKVIIANSLGELCEMFKSSDEKTVVFFWIYAIANGLQIYFDFSGYSDMAIGIGRILGFKFVENFNYPYISKSITEFWRRWHISLGTWFRDYVYIPLGGNQVSQIKWFRNIVIVWVLTGFWHGASWNFMVWGLFFGLLLIIEKKWLLRHLESSKVFSHIYLIILTVISFVIFQAVDMTEALEYIKSMFGMGGVSLISAETLYYLRSYGMILLISIIAATPLAKNVVGKLENSSKYRKIVGVGEVVYLFMLLLVATAYLIDGSFNPFLYFRF